jgi:nitrogen regulatory protein P-II 1
MKEVKAYVRVSRVEYIIRRLEETGVKDMTVIRVDAFAALADEGVDEAHLVRKYPEKYSAIAKIEIVCRDDQVKPILAVIRECGHTGQPGDGRIFVYDVQNAINIRTGEEGEKAL